MSSCLSRPNPVTVPEQPVVTVATVVFNDAQNIRQTLESVIGQGVALQYVVIDGGSTDGTREILSEYSDYVDVLLSEPDRGVYHAMNKAIALAKGKWMCFMNSGDFFYQSHTLENLFSWFKCDADVIFGDWEVRGLKSVRIVRAQRQQEKIWQGMLASHQACLVRTGLLQQFGFDESKQIAADFHFLYRLYQNGCVFQFVPLTLASISAGGLSDRKRMASLYERWQSVEKNRQVHVYYFYRMTLEMIKYPFRKVLGRI